MAATIGRFEIVRKLGMGAQGTVYLARDTRLDRQVAIKALRTGTGNMETLLQEARIVSKLQHYNIVTLFDAGEHKGEPYLVYAYVEGQTLAQLIKNEKTLSLTRAAKIASSILDGIGYAHQQGIMHLDIKPANIMIASGDHPLVMDFGIARTVAQQSAKENKINGSPHYIAPEIILRKNPTPSADLFSLGMVLYELVTGTPAVDSSDIYEIFHKIANEAAESPSARNIHIDERLEGIILKAIAKNPEERYVDAAAMKKALQDYLDPTGNEQLAIGGKSHSTLDFLLRRMRSKSDFPILSSTISEINKVVDNESASTNILTMSILQDFALTNKLLKLVNTVSYGQFGGKINTISKAVVILGFETVRNVAMTLILFEFLQNKAQASQLKDEVLSSFFAGIVAAQFLDGRNIKDVEEAMICSMFRNLGKLLATLYFFEESQEIARLMEQEESEDKAAVKVLGITYGELGIGIAKSWNFPPRLLAGMRKLAGDAIMKPQGELENLTVIVNLANELCSIANKDDGADKSKALKQLARRYERAMPVSEIQLRKALESGLGELSTRAGIMSIDLANSTLMKRVNAWVGARHEVSGDKKVTEPDSLDGITQLGMEVENPGGKADEHTRVDPETVLLAGIQDVTNTLVEEHQLNDIMQMVLETMHRGMDFNRTLILVRDGKNNMAARFGFGQESEVVLPKFQFSMEFVPDVFHLAMSKGADLLIEDITAENIAAKIPKWYRDAVTSQSFLLLPVIINGKPIALFYADMEQANAMQVSQKQLSLLRTLRNQAVLAIKQKM